VKLDIFPDGTLKNVALHDGYILGVLILPEKLVEIIVQEDFSRRQFTIRLHGVEHFLCDEFREGNIILSFHFYSGIAPSRCDVEELLGSPHPDVAQDYKDKHDAFLMETLRRITAGECVFVRSYTSYGAEIFALCGDVEIEPR
jgi:hypothetical protein